MKDGAKAEADWDSGVFDRLREFAKKVKMPLQEIADKAQVNYTQLVNYGRIGRSGEIILPGGAVLIRMEESVGLSCRWWLRGKGPMLNNDEPSITGELLDPQKVKLLEDHLTEMKAILRGEGEGGENSP